MQQATYDDWDWQMSVNLGGMINGIQTFIPRMLKHGLGAHIVNTASMAGFLPLPGCAIYCTTKFAVRGLSECLQLDLAPQGIGVSVLCPGAVNTNIHEAVLTRPKHLSNTGYYGADPTVMKSLKEVISPGLRPGGSRRNRGAGGAGEPAVHHPVRGVQRHRCRNASIWRSK